MAVESVGNRLGMSCSGGEGPHSSQIQEGALSPPNSPGPLQAMDITTVRAVLSEIRPLLVPSRFEKAQQPDAQTLHIGLRTLEGLRWLEISWQAEAPRLLLIPPPDRAGEGSTLARQLRHSLHRLALVALLQEGFERVVELRFALRPGAPASRRLIVELMGRHSNALLLDEAGRLITLARQVSERQSRRRPLSTGDGYHPSPPLAGRPPSREEPYEHWRAALLSLVPEPLERAMRRTYQGMSPALMRQLSAACGQPPGDGSVLRRHGHSLREEDWKGLWSSWQRWLTVLESDQFDFRATDDGGYRCWTTRSSLAADDRSPHHDPAPGPGAINASLANYYRQRLTERRLHDDGRRLRQQLLRTEGREACALREQQRLLKGAAEAAVLREAADQLLCLPQPSREEVDRAQSLYRRSRRLRRSLDSVPARVAHHETRLEAIRASLSYLEAIHSDAQNPHQALLTLEELWDDSSPLIRGGDRRSARRGVNAQGRNASGPLELSTPSGLRLLVGRNHRENDRISLRDSRRGDLWFHAQECPGSHVVLRGSEAPYDQEDVQLAADVAAFCSRARGSRRVSVHVVPTEHLRRIPGSAPGTVRHRDGELIWADPERARPLVAGPLS